MGRLDRTEKSVSAATKPLRLGCQLQVILERASVDAYPMEWAHSITDTEGFRMADGVAASLSRSVTWSWSLQMH